MELVGVAKVLGGKKVLHMEINNRLDLVELSRKGLTKNALSHLSKFMNISINQMTKLLPVTGRTIQRYALKEHLSPAVSEHVLQIAEVVATGIKVFEDKEKFLTWLNFPNRAIGKRKPISLLDSKFGAEMVLDELYRIKYGVYS